MSLIRQAIVTKYFGPGNVKGSRIKATASAGGVTVPYDHSLNTDGNHAAAAQALATKYAWVGSWVGGGMPEGNGNVFVCVETDGMSNYGFAPSFVVEA